MWADSTAEVDGEGMIGADVTFFNGWAGRPNHRDETVETRAVALLWMIFRHEADGGSRGTSRDRR
jgi:hypothetical protein